MQIHLNRMFDISPNGIHMGHSIRQKKNFIQWPWARLINWSAFDRFIECLMKHFLLLMLVIIRINLNNVRNTAKRKHLILLRMQPQQQSVLFFTLDKFCLHWTVFFFTSIPDIIDINKQWRLIYQHERQLNLISGYIILFCLFENQSEHRLKLVKITRICYLF